MTVCLRCNKCCYHIVNGIVKKCKHSIVLDSGRSLCRIYNKRLGTVIFDHKNGKETRCTLREKSPYDYPGCPFNTNKPIHPIYKQNMEEQENGKETRIQ